MKKRNCVNVFFLFFFCNFALAACFGSNGNGGNDGGDNEPTEEEVRNMSTWVLLDAIWSLHNRYVAGEQCGSELNKIDESCAAGGTVNITGRLDCGTGYPEERDVTYAFTNCTESEEGGIITFTDGSCRQQGQWVTDDYQQMTYSGTSTMHLTLFIRDEDYDVDDPQCQFSISEEMQGGDWSHSGLFCGETFHW